MRELQGEHRSFLGQFAEFLFPFFVEQGTAAHESVIAIVQQAFLLGSQLAVVQVHVFHSLEEFFVQSHVICMLGEHGLQLLGQGLHLVVGLGAHQVEEHGRYPAQQVVIPVIVFLGIDDGIVECGLFGIVDGLLYLLIIAADAFQKSLFVVLHPNTVEGHGVMWCLVVLKKGVYANFIVVHIAIFNPLLKKQPQKYAKFCISRIVCRIFNDYLLQ